MYPQKKFCSISPLAMNVFTYSQTTLEFYFSYITTVSFFLLGQRVFLITSQITAVVYFLPKTSFFNFTPDTSCFLILKQRIHTPQQTIAVFSFLSRLHMFLISPRKTSGFISKTMTSFYFPPNHGC